MYKLFYFPRNASWAPHLILKALGVEFELELVNRKNYSQKAKKYLELNPTGRIPTLIDNDQAIFESGAIALYLSEKHPEGKLIPSLGTPERASCLQWLFYLTATLQPELMVYFYPENHTNNISYSTSIAEAQEHRITQMFSLLNDQIGEGNYLIGNSITVCDYFLFMLCHWASEFKHPPLNFSHLARCLRGLASIPSFQEVCSIECTCLKIYS